jgi:hypothetical protein
VAWFGIKSGLASQDSSRCIGILLATDLMPHSFSLYTFSSALH